MTVSKLDEQAVFNVARQIDAREARRLYLEQACGDDVDLFARVEALLRVYDEQQSFLQPTAHGRRGGVERSPTDEAPGAVIGPYKILQQIGEGGMGIVFMAEQTEPVRRKVALKVIKPGMDSKQVIARFEAERQALAMMDHANIARVLDAGATQSGRPYFVMELVHGIPVTKYCDDNHLTPRERLELFVPVCHAIQHAHQKGIIHRDIKPSNIMVTLYDGRPVAKVIDFGVAKATEQRLTERTLFTQYGTLVGTFQYMSPEQAEMSALGVDTRSDIYSLGVVLYELLTGNTPLSQEQVREATYAEVLRMIKEEEPPKPSTRLSESGQALASISAQRKTEPSKLTRLMRGELDWIVMKCLEKDRNRRYETANSFAADLLRYLSDEPVKACPPSAMYRFGKIARRNNRILAAAAVVVLTLCLGTAISTWQALRATRAETLAETRLEAEKQARAEAVANLRKAREAGEEFFTLVSESLLLEEPGLQPLRKQLLEAAVRHYEGLAALSETSDPEGLADLAATQIRLVQIYYQTGFHESHVSALEKAVASTEKLLKECPENAALHARLAGLWHGGRRMVSVAQDVDRERAMRAYEHAIVVGKKLVKRYPQVIGFQSDLSKLHDLLAGRQLEAGRREDALESWRRVREIREGIVKSDPDVYEHIAELSHAYLMVSKAIEDSDADEAEALYHRAVEIQKDAPDVPNYQEFLAFAHEDFAKFLVTQKRFQEAKQHQREACHISKRLVAQFPHVSSYRQTLEDRERELRAPGFQSLADDILANAEGLKEKGAIQEAIGEYDRATQLDPKNVVGWSKRADLLIDLALWPEAAVDFGQAFQIEEPADSLTFLLHAVVRRCVDDDDGYREVCRRMLSRFANSTNPDDCSFIARALVISPEPSIDPSRAVAFAERAVADNKWADRVAHVGLARYRAGAFDCAVAALEESLALDVNSNPPDVHSALAMALHRLGKKEQSRVALDTARTVRQERLEALLAHNGGLDVAVWSNWNFLFQELFYKEAYTLLHGSPPPEDPYLLLLRGRGLEAVGRADEARAEFDRAFRLLPDELAMRVYQLPHVDRSDAFAAGLADLRELVKQHPEQTAQGRSALARAHLRLGRKLFELNRQDEAESILSLIDSFAPASSDVFLERDRFRQELHQRNGGRPENRADGQDNTN